MKADNAGGKGSKTSRPLQRQIRGVCMAQANHDRHEDKEDRQRQRA
jgi:hypothetical protein